MLKDLDAYGSDDSDSEPAQLQNKPVIEVNNTSKSLLSLPPPVNLAKPRPRRAVFTVTKPSKSFLPDDEEDEEEKERIAKKPKLESKTRTGKSSLLAMLPAPHKPTLPVSEKSDNLMAVVSHGLLDEGVVPETVKVDGDTPFIPPSLLKSNPKTKPALTQSSVDFFSLGSHVLSFPKAVSSIGSKYTTVKQTLPALPSMSSSVSTSISSAPDIPTFEPPEPTSQDPYPGYYQLPSGEWAAYDREYYMKYYNSWAAEIQEQEKDSYESKYGESVQVDVHAQLDLARKEQEERKALTQNAGKGPSAPRMNIKAAKAGSLAKTRHQLSTLLTEAYENREALEERIAQAKRNRKESGNKYGF